MEVKCEQTTESNSDKENKPLAAQDLPDGELVDQAVSITQEKMPSEGTKNHMVDGDMVDGNKEELEMKASKLSSVDKLSQSKIMPKHNISDIMCNLKANCLCTNDRGEPAQFSRDVLLEDEKIEEGDVIVDPPDLTVGKTNKSRTEEIQSNNFESPKQTNQWSSEFQSSTGASIQRLSVGTVMRNCSSQTSSMSTCRKKPSKSHQQLVPRCLIHSIPKLVNCLTCNEQCCAQCLLIDGLCYSKGHQLTEASHIAVQREKLKLMKSLESASSDLNQLEFYTRDLDSELQYLEVKRLLRREEIHQEFTSITDLLIKRKNCVLRQLDEEVTHRKQYLESKLKSYQRLQQAEVQLTEEVTTLVQTTCDQNHVAFVKASSDCEKFSSTVKTAELPQQMALTSLLDNPFSLYREKSQIDNALTRETIANGELRFKQKTMYIDLRDKLVLEKLLEIPCFPTSSRQTFTVEMFLSSFRHKVWHTSVPTLEGLVLSSDQPGFLLWPLFKMVLLRVRVSISIETSDTKHVIKESKPTHMMICATDAASSYMLRPDDYKSKKKK